jgi:hypothetical protein
LFETEGKVKPSHSAETLLTLSKDWPSTSEFKQEFPELFNDFSESVPIPNYTRRDGVLNVAAHFPSNAIAPDIGASLRGSGILQNLTLHLV